MARYFSYDDIVARELPLTEDAQWLAGQIAQLPAFVEGTAVVCGSVSWGKHSWRSDIDVAHFSTIEHPHVEPSINDLIARYHERTQNRYIAPRVDVITVGAQSPGVVEMHASVSVGGISAGPSGKNEIISKVFAETIDRFADHVGALARLKGEPWQSFLKNHLTLPTGRPDRRESITAYVSLVTNAWAQQPLHRLNMTANGRFTQNQLDVMGQAENYPVNLMRRILSERGCYPSPDTVADVWSAFSGLNEPWSTTLLAELQPFVALNERYGEIVEACRRPQNPLPAADYHDTVSSLFSGLRFGEVQQIVGSYVKR